MPRKEEKPPKMDKKEKDTLLKAVVSKIVHTFKSDQVPDNMLGRPTLQGK